MYCREPVVGRIDKRFCDDHCRNAYHNAARRAYSAGLLPVQRQLTKNYRILKALHTQGVREVHLEYLRGRGFNDRFCTQRSNRPDETIIYDLVLERGNGRSFRLREKVEMQGGQTATS